jgi:succinate dehydrogenase/fumarate reductase-like Fe-S protein
MREGTVSEQLMEGNLDEAHTMKVSVRRTPPAAEVETFEVPYKPGMSVYNILELIRDTIDTSLAVPISCRIGKCDICFIRVNGRVRWSCTAAPIDGMLIEPAPHYVVMKDLVVDYGRRVKPDGQKKESSIRSDEDGREASQ